MIIIYITLKKNIINFFFFSLTNSLVFKRRTRFKRKLKHQHVLLPFNNLIHKKYDNSRYSSTS